MTHTFDIRFAQWAGLAALFAAPSNHFRWKGAGRLSIDGQGVSIVRRGLFGPLTRRMHRIPAGQLTEVYREGAALRLAFNSGGSARVLPLWALGSEAAAEIVKLLPTRKTVELEHSTDSNRYRLDWHAAFRSLVFIAVFAVGSVLLLREFGDVSPAASDETVASLPGATATESHNIGAEPGNEPTASSAHAPGAPVPAAMKSREGIVPAGRESSTTDNSIETRASDAATAASLDSETAVPEIAESAPYVPPRYFGNYATENSNLRYDYYNWKGRVSADGLNALENRWWELTVDIYRHSHTGVEYGPSLAAKELAISRAWRNHLAMFAESVRTGDQSLMVGAQAELELAEQLSREAGLQ